MCVLALAYFSLVPPTLKAETGAPGQLNHAFGYAVTGAALRWAYPLLHPFRLVLLLALYGCALEGLQSLVPGRDAKAVDALSSSLGGALGVLLGGALLTLVAHMAGGRARLRGSR